MSQLRILCVDDDPAVLQSLQAILQLKGFDVVAASTVPEALQLINKHPFDVLLADLNLCQPGDGFTVVSAMRRVHPETCTFILTGYPDIESAIRAIRGQVDEYFSKPLNVSELLTAIESVKQGKRVAKTFKLLDIAQVLAARKASIIDHWYSAVMRVPELAAIPLNKSERVDHIPELLDELIDRMQDTSITITRKLKEASQIHGRLRYAQGYEIQHLATESRMLQQILSETIQAELLNVKLSTLVPDVFSIGQRLQAALEISIHAYQAVVPKSLQSSFSALHSSPHLGVAISDELRIIDANAAFLEMTGYTRAQLAQGQVLRAAMIAGEFRQLHLNAVEQLREFGTCVPFESELTHPDGSSVPVLTGAVRLSLEPLQWCTYIIDLKHQRELQEAEQKLRTLESRNTLINHLAHEINNPLAALMFTFYLLATHEGVSLDARELVRGAGKMLGRVNDAVSKVLVESRNNGGNQVFVEQEKVSAS